MEPWDSCGLRADGRVSSSASRSRAGRSSKSTWSPTPRAFAFDPHFIRLHLKARHLPLLDEGAMHLLALLSCSLLPIRHSALIQSIGMHDGLDRTSLRQYGHHHDDPFSWRSQSFEHGSSSCTKGSLTHPTAIAIGVATLNSDGALSDLTSCRTRRMRAKLF